MKKITDEEIRNYIGNGGKPIVIRNIDSYRDGGTVVIDCGYSEQIRYFLHKDDYTIHDGYPTTEENKISDDLLKRYLLHSMNVYRDRKYSEVLRIEDFIDKIEENENR